MHSQRGRTVCRGPRARDADLDAVVVGWATDRCESAVSGAYGGRQRAALPRRRRRRPSTHLAWRLSSEQHQRDVELVQLVQVELVRVLPG
jgi:hypothetical protein